MKIISVDMAYNVLKSESPTTSHFFNLFKIADRNSDEQKRFKDIISSVTGIGV
jgi:hypothetical protein